MGEKERARKRECELKEDKPGIYVYRPVSKGRESERELVGRRQRENVLTRICSIKTDI